MGLGDLYGMVMGQKALGGMNDAFEKTKKLAEDKRRWDTEMGYKNRALDMEHPSLESEAQDIEKVRGMGGTALEDVLRMKGKDTDTELGDKSALTRAQVAWLNAQSGNLPIKTQIEAEYKSGMGQEKSDKDYLNFTTRAEQLNKPTNPYDPTTGGMFDKNMFEQLDPNTRGNLMRKPGESVEQYKDHLSKIDAMVTEMPNSLQKAKLERALTHIKRTQSDLFTNEFNQNAAPEKGLLESLGF